MMTSNTTIQLYAEHLLNIQALTLTATLSSNSTSLTKAKLSADATSLTLSHENASATIRLPTTIEGGADAVLELPKQAAKDLQLRLRLEEKEPDNHFIKDNATICGISQEENWVPWSAPNLESKKGVFSCRNCGVSFLTASNKSGTLSATNGNTSPDCTISHWKDLPNENWAEMMDFWHCHKPDTEDATHEAAVHDKGYAAGSRIQAAQGTGFIDLAYFLLDSSDCRSIKANDSNTLHCAKCQAEVGVSDERAGGWRIWKWALSFTPSNGKLSLDNPTIPKWISALFLFTIENQGVRKIAVYDTDADTTTGVLLWIFTPDLTFSSSYQPAGAKRQDPTRAMKVFWQGLGTYIGGHIENIESTSIEEVKFPSRLYTELQDALEESKRILPAKSQEFRGWNVALLPRFQGYETD